MNNILQKRLDYLALVSGYAAALPQDYQPKTIEIFCNGYRVLRITNGTQIELLSDEPDLLEVHWDGEVVQARTSEGAILVDRLPADLCG
jgi:hypothetical protein